MKSLTVRELKEALRGVPNDAIVRLTSDTGVDQGYGVIVVENAYYSGNSFDIYANDEDEEYEEEDEEEW